MSKELQLYKISNHITVYFWIDLLTNLHVTGKNTREIVLCVDPEIGAEINVTDITQTSVRVSWSTGQTQRVDSTVVYYKVTGATQWTRISHAGQSTSHIVSSLQPGTEYQFYVEITSYGKKATSEIVTVTTGKMKLLGLYFRVHVVYAKL